MTPNKGSNQSTDLQKEMAKLRDEMQAEVPKHHTRSIDSHTVWSPHTAFFLCLAPAYSLSPS